MTDVPSAGQMQISEDTPCVQCGYNLRGLTQDKSCPECGTPIARSVLGDQLRYADPQWLERLRFGTSLKLWNILIAIVIGAVAAIIGGLGLPQALVELLALVGAGLGLWAAFLITTPEPRVLMREDPINLRKLVRACAVASVLGQFSSHAQRTAAADIRVVLTIVAGVLAVAGVVQMFGELVYYRRFAHRIPDARLQKSTTIVLWGLPSAFAALLIGGAIVKGVAILVGAGIGASSGPGGPPLGRAAVAGGVPFVCAGVVAVLVFGLWYIRLLTSYRKAFEEAAADARQFGAPPTAAR
ncbi:MAG: hypothetical protein JSV19_07865 [Phycisphaerales bacterium]|nr:MAG: hypothetical protein JSV19_07865 [Phycisphaerales bacterium]